MSDGGRERWTIDYAKQLIRGPSTHGEVEVVPASELEQAREALLEIRGAACEALDALEGYLQGESGLPFTEPYGAARKAAGYLRAALDPGAVAAEDCETCGGTGWHTFDPPVGAHDANQTEPCPDCGGAVAEGDGGQE